MEYKKIKLTETRECIGGCQGQENRGSGRKCSRGTKFQLQDE